MLCLPPQTDAEQNHLEHAHCTGMGLGPAVERWSAPFSAPEFAVWRNVSTLPRRLGEMGCGGPWARAWNLGNHDNRPVGDNKHGMEFQHSQPGHGGMGKFGEVFLFLTQGWGRHRRESQCSE